MPLIIAASFVLSLFAWITKMKIRYGDPDGIGSYGQIMCGVLTVNFFYNSSLITESGYLLFAALALPFVYYKEIIFSQGRNRMQDICAVPEAQPDIANADLFTVTARKTNECSSVGHRPCLSHGKISE